MSTSPGLSSLDGDPGASRQKKFSNRNAVPSCTGRDRRKTNIASPPPGARNHVGVVGLVGLGHVAEAFVAQRLAAAGFPQRGSGVGFAKTVFDLVEKRDLAQDPGDEPWGLPEGFLELAPHVGRRQGFPANGPRPTASRKHHREPPPCLEKPTPTRHLP
jgi:hypothetical protein